MRLFSDVSSRVDDPYLAHAMALALQARSSTWPNPIVGCVLVADGRIVGEGYHPGAGHPHAEVFALQDAGSAARGATVYVTLEPCAHHGRTAPCARALIDAGVSRVVIGMRDPHDAAAGGVEILRAAGIDVELAADPTPFAEINQGWLKRIATGIPLLTAKVAMSLDGRTSFASGVRASITGPSGGEVTALLRSAADAVMVSAATVTIDDPALTIRESSGALAATQPLRVILVRDGCPSPESAVFTDCLAETLVLAADSADPVWLDALPSHVRVERWARAEGFGGALGTLGSLGIGDVLVEPGPRLLTALWADDVIDRLVTVTAGGMAGAQAPGSFLGEADRHLDTLTHRFAPLEAGIVGDVSVTVWSPCKGSDAE